MNQRGLRTVRLGAAPGMVAAFTAGCCIFGPRQAWATAGGERPEGEIALHVVNHTDLDFVIYVVHDARADPSRYRATGTSTERRSSR